MKTRKLIMLFAGMAFAIMLQGCSTPKANLCGGPGDTPQDHFVAGMEALEQGRVETAREKFERSIYCDRDFSPPYGGLAIVYAYAASRQIDPAHREVEMNRANGYLKSEGKKMRTEEDELLHHLAVMRTVTIAGGEGWLAETEGAYRSGRALAAGDRQLLYYQGTESLGYFMGLAFMKARELQDARALFAGVLNTKKDGKWHAYADAAWKQTDMTVRASAGDTLGETGRKIALLDRINRRDLAVLLANELGIGKVFAGRIPQLTAPGAHTVQATPADISSDPFRNEITTVLGWRIRGLEVKYDGAAGAYLFRPDEVVSRGEMALVLEDIIIKLTGDESIATAYLGHGRSPFPDVKVTSPLYNAVTVVTTRGIMEPGLSGEFRAASAANGAEAVLAVRALKQRVNVK